MSTTTVNDPYAVLGISRSATPDEVKKAYRKKARENHPDLNPNDPGAAERMNQINEAYDRIMNPEKYAARDRRANASGAYGGAGTHGTSGYGSAGYGPAGSGAGGQGGYGGPYGGAGAGYRGAGSGYGSPYAGQGAGGSYAGNPSGSSRAGEGGSRGNGYGYGTEGPYGWTGGFGFDFDDLFGFGGAGAADSEPIHPEVSACDSATVRQAIAAMNAGDYKQAVTLLASVVSRERDARWYYLSALAQQGAGNTVMALELIRKAVQADPQNADYQRAQRQFQHAGTAYQQESQARGFSVGFVDPGTICCGLCLAQMMCRAFMPYF